MTEAQLQSKIIRWLRDQDAYVIKTRVLPGVPVGCPDIFAFYEDRWMAIEVKKSAKAPFRQGQKETLQRLRKGNTFVYVAYPENWDFLQREILSLFF